MIKILFGVVLVIALVGLYMNYRNARDEAVAERENFEDSYNNSYEYTQSPEDTEVNSQNNNSVALENTVDDYQNEDVPKASSSGNPSGNEVYASIGENDYNSPFGLKKNQLPNDCYPKDQLTPKDLLPQDPNSKWAQVNPAGQGEVGDQNFLNAGHHMGINTVGQTLRNANLQLRSEPPNPQVKVSPWGQTTIEPDSNRRAMEIGGAE